jgi:hypothetical protein
MVQKHYILFWYTWRLRRRQRVIESLLISKASSQLSVGRSTPHALFSEVTDGKGWWQEVSNDRKENLNTLKNDALDDLLKVALFYWYKLFHGTMLHFFTYFWSIVLLFQYLIWLKEAVLADGNVMYRHVFLSFLFSLLFCLFVLFVDRYYRCLLKYRFASAYEEILDR